MYKLIIPLISFFTFSFSNQLFSPLPQTISYDEKKVSLGKKLFFDPILSKNKDISCFTCHNNYGVDNLAVSIGSDGLKGTMNSQSIFNAPFKLAFFWDGRSSTLEDQMINGPLFQSHEMASSKKLIMKRIISSQEYIELIDKAYQKKPSFEIILDAVAKFQNTLITPNSKFDKYLRDEVQLDPSEKKGMDLFIGYGCVSCHNGINIGSNSFQQFGTVFTVDENSSSKNENLIFIVPSLRNVEKTYPYFHDGSIKTLKEAIEIMGYHNVGIQLTNDEIDAIESFLKTFTGELPKNFKDSK